MDKKEEEIILAQLKKFFMQKTILFLILILFFLSSITVAFAQVNEELISVLNKALICEVKSKEQCEWHSNKFNIAIPYQRIIMDKESTINVFMDIITALGGKIKRDWLKIEKAASLFQALNIDAYSEIQLVQIYDEILDKYGYPEVRRIVTSAKDRAVEHFMLLTNMEQRIIMESK